MWQPTYTGSPEQTRNTPNTNPTTPQVLHRRESFKHYNAVLGTLPSSSTSNPSSPYLSSEYSSEYQPIRPQYQSPVSQIDRLREQNRLLNRQLNNAKSLLQSSKSGELESAYSQCRELRQQLASAYKTMGDDILELKTTISQNNLSHQQERQKYESRLEALRSQKQAVEAEYKRTKERLNRMELEAQIEPKQVVDLKRQLNTLQEDYNSLRRTISSDAETVRVLTQETRLHKYQVETSQASQRKILQMVDALQKEKLGLEEQIVALNNSIRRGDADILKLQSRSNQLEKLVASLKMELEAKNKQVQAILNQRDELVQKVNILRAEKHDFLQSQKSLMNANQQQTLSKARQQNMLLLRQLQEKTDEVGALKHRIAQMASSINKITSSDQVHKLKEDIAKLQLDNAKLRKYSKNPSSQFDQVLKMQLTEAQKYKQAINAKTEETYTLREQLNHMRNRLDAANRDFEMQRLKFTVEKKNLASQIELEKESQMSETEVIRKQKKALEERLKRASQESKKKDLFIQQYLIGRVKEDNDKVFIQNVFKDMHKTLNL